MFKSVLETLSDTEISVITNQLANVEIPNKSIIKQLRGKASFVVQRYDFYLTSS